jgi:hypothetical protein
VCLCVCVCVCVCAYRYSDYARGPSSYGGSPGKVHKLYETTLVQTEEREDPLDDLIESRAQLGFLLVNVTLAGGLRPRIQQWLKAAYTSSLRPHRVTATSLLQVA